MNEYKKLIHEIMIASDLIPFPSKELYPAGYKKNGAINQQRHGQFTIARSSMLELACDYIECGDESVPISTDKKVALFACEKSFNKWNDLMRVIYPTPTRNYSTGLFDTAKHKGVVYEAHANEYRLYNEFKEQLASLIDDIVNDRFIKPKSLSRFKRYAFKAPEAITDITYFTPNITAIGENILREDLPAMYRVWLWAFTKFPAEIPQYYSAKEGQRMFAKGGLTVQNRPSMIRSIVCQGMYSYDISGCAFAVMLNAAVDNDPMRFSEYPTVFEYVSDTAKFRRAILDEVGTDIEMDAVKLMINSVAFGGNYRNPYSSVVKTLTASVATRIGLTEKFQNIAQEWDEIKALLITREGSKKQYNRDCSLFYQHLERTVIEAVRDCQSDRTRCVVVHDEVIAPDDLDINDVMLYVKKKTGMTITIRKKQL